MEHLETRMKRLLLAGIGAAAITRERSDNLLQGLIQKGEAVIDRSGIRNEQLHRSEAHVENLQEMWEELLPEMSPAQLRALRQALDSMETGDEGCGDAVQA